MKIFILVIITAWSLGGGFQNTPRYEIVTSPREAAIFVWNDKCSALSVEPDHKRYELYEINIGEKTITWVPIPEIKFVYKD